MYTIHEGEIVIKEKYCSGFNDRYYVKPTDQNKIIAVKDTIKKRNYMDYFYLLFLPKGYPDSVSKDYMAYQMWDTAQCFCSTVTGILATQEVLRGVGVGDTEATPLAATITWVIKDGCGHVGKILFAYTHGSLLDAYSKKWRLYADTLNDAAMCLELSLPLFKEYTTMVLCFSTMLKAIVGVAGGATRAAMTQHHALRGNMADVSAKDAAQETAVNLVASVFAVLIISLFGSPLYVFLFMMVHHLVFNYLAVRAVCLKTLNEPRFLQLIYDYLTKEIISSPCPINRDEPIIFYHMGANLLDLKLCGFHILLGHSVESYFKVNSKASYIRNLREIYKCDAYILLPELNNKIIYVALKDNATSDDILCSYFHAVLLAIITCSINNHPLAVYVNYPDRPFAKVCETIKNSAWCRDDMMTNSKSMYRDAPSIEVMDYLDKVVQKEWRQIRNVLIQTGWDLSKVLLTVDEWRLCSAKLINEAISADSMINPEKHHTIPTKVVTFGNAEQVPPAYLFDAETYTIEPENISPPASPALSRKGSTSSKQSKKVS